MTNHSKQMTTGHVVPTSAIQTNRNRPVKDFEGMNLGPALLRGIYAYGGRNVIMQAQSCTGKSASYFISILQKLDLSNPQCQALVLAPTIELSHAIKAVILALGGYLKVDCYVCIGGANAHQDIIRLKNGVQVLVGTPGRVNDMINRGALKTDSIKMFVMDEADEMFSRGFKDQIYDIFQHLPQKHTQVVLVSAIMFENYLELTTPLLKNPVRIHINTERRTLRNVQQFYINVTEEWKLDTLYDIYNSLTTKQLVVFCNTRKKADWLAEKLHLREFTVSTINEEMDPEQRKVIMDGSRPSRVLIMTNLMAQSIDVRQMSLFVNYDMPLHKEDYFHRVGRLSRVGYKSATINLVTAEDASMIQEIVRFYSTRIVEFPFDVSDF
ncbi:translation initiation factor eIF4A [Mortierella polycephala]|uniref:RNA helicase n=1 Tax=Mortierella polycephala TaxID=41804 RepID=A0A9P6Q8F8_9FUNG|nr:translation initiation factor eIF4A [Mortierella polycephala]